MTHEETIQKLVELKLLAMVALLREWLQSPPPADTTFEERLALLADRETTERKNRLILRRLKDAKLPMPATIEDLWADPARGIDKATARSLAGCQWVRAQQNVIAVGPTGLARMRSAKSCLETSAAVIPVRETSKITMLVFT